MTEETNVNEIAPKVGKTPQKFDSVIRTATTSILSLFLVGSVLVIALRSPNETLTGAGAVLVGWAGVVVGFYFGGHVAQNTAHLEETRQAAATLAAEASALRAEAAERASREKA